ncbi:hypothetical protein [Catenulispora pinisilvae]|uniref:hypothetical protein n=1 Tax=Catenulispora pinisilvae TaxID=2705253 RepID=UPI001891F8EA|nr:hypothetical protein [Catenulispora pinisilvae]
MKKLFAGLLTAGALSITALAAGPAQAATNGHEAEFWTSTSTTVTISGNNQNGVPVQHSWNVGAETEFKSYGYWWVGTITYYGNHSHSKTCYIPVSHPGDFTSCTGLTAN